MRVVGTFIMPCGSCPACLRGRDDICEPFFAFNRLRGALYDGETRLYRADGSPLAMYSMGGLAEYAVLPATAVFALPDAITLEDAADPRAARRSRRTAQCGTARSFASASASPSWEPGASGRCVVQFARAQGASQVVAVDISEEKLQARHRRSAPRTWSTHAVEDPVERVLAVTDGGVDVAFEVLGRPETFLQAVEMLRDGGRMVAVGIAPVGERAAVEITRLVRRGLRIVGSYGGRPRTDMPSLLALVERGVLRPQDGISRRSGWTRRSRVRRARQARDRRAGDRGDRLRVASRGDREAAELHRRQPAFVPGRTGTAPRRASAWCS